MRGRSPFRANRARPLRQARPYPPGPWSRCGLANDVLSISLRNRSLCRIPGLMIDHLCHETQVNNQVPPL